MSFFASFAWQEIALWPVLMVREIRCKEGAETHCVLVLSLWGGELGIIFG